MERVLVGVDGSPASLHALRWTADVCDRAGLVCVAARVFAPSQAEVPPDLDAELHTRQREELEDWCQGLRMARPPETVLLDGKTPDALLAGVETYRADALVVGRHRRDDMRHAGVGGVAHALTQHTTVPFAIVPGAEMETLSHVVVGVDGSAASLGAVDVVAELAQRLRVGVTAVLAFDPLVDLVPETHPESWRRQAEDAVRGWTKPIIDAGVPLEVDVDRDVHPVAAIVRALGSHPGSVACVGAREVHEVTEVRLGRKALHVLRHTDAPILLVPPRRGTGRT